MIWAKEQSKRYYPFQVCFSFTLRHALVPVGRYNNSLLMTWQAAVQTLGLIHDMNICTNLIMTYVHGHNSYYSTHQWFVNDENVYIGKERMWIAEDLTVMCI